MPLACLRHLDPRGGEGVGSGSLWLPVPARRLVAFWAPLRRQPAPWGYSATRGQVDDHCRPSARSCSSVRDASDALPTGAARLWEGKIKDRGSAQTARQGWRTCSYPRRARRRWNQGGRRVVQRGRRVCLRDSGNVALGVLAVSRPHCMRGFPNSPFPLPDPCRISGRTPGTNEPGRARQVSAAWRRGRHLWFYGRSAAARKR